MKRQALLIVALAMVLLSVVSHAQSDKQDPVPTLRAAEPPAGVAPKTTAEESAVGGKTTALTTSGRKAGHLTPPTSGATPPEPTLHDTGSGWTLEDPETLEGGSPGCFCGFDAATGAPVCWDDLFCDVVAPCAPDGTCAPGMVCVTSNCCPPPLDFGCFPICPDGPACNNPGVCGSFEACDGGGGGEAKSYEIPLPAPGDIPDNDPVGFRHDFFVPDHGIILDLDVDVTIMHTWVGDLCVVLEKKTDDGAGVTALLIDRPGADAGVPCHQGSPFGCSENNYVNIILDDEGAGGAIENQCPVGGNLTSPPNYTPNNPLSAFDGIDKFGLWSITVTDNAAGDLGTLHAWSLHMVNEGDGGPDLLHLDRPPSEPDSDPGTPMDDPTGAWHELWPNFCNPWHCNAWQDNGNGFLDECDFMRMQKGEGPKEWYHVENVTVTITVTEKVDPPPPQVYLDWTGDNIEEGLFNPLSHPWHQIWPQFCKPYQMLDWLDTNGDGRLSASDQVFLLNLQSGHFAEYHIDEVSTDIEIHRQDPPGPVCGDGACEPPETCESCPGDCGQCPFCGDGVVNQPGEECDGADDLACPGQCQADCTCGGPGCDDCADGMVDSCNQDPECHDCLKADGTCPCVQGGICDVAFACPNGDADCAPGQNCCIATCCDFPICLDPCGDGGPSDCCEVHDTPGCDCQACEDLVCAIEPSCCVDLWHPICTAFAQIFCDPLCAGGDFDCGGGGEAKSYEIPLPAPGDIPDDDPVGFRHEFFVPDHGIILDLDVDVTITHTWVGDLCVVLEKKTDDGAGVTALLIDRSGADAGVPCHQGNPFGCSENNYVNIILDDEGAGGAIENQCPVGGNLTSPPNYTPNSPLSAFDGIDKFGLWSITVTDNAAGDLGTLDSWSLHMVNEGDGGPVCGDGVCEPPETCDSCPADCGPCPFCGPGNGDCCNPNGTPGCDNEACCEAVCAIDPFCCDEMWDSLCAYEAVIEPICECPCPPGDPCEDANACTQNDTCDDAGNCVGIPTECDDGDPCTIDGCDPVFGCESQPIECPEGQVCENGECVLGCGNCPTDSNGDLQTGPFDLASLLACWGPVAVGCECFDANGDGEIAPFDLATLLASWGPCPPPQPRCDNPHNVSGVIRECFHWANQVNGTPCRTTECIENTLDTCTCDYHPDETGDPECDVDATTGPKIVQVGRTTPGSCPATVAWADWELSRTRHGCGTECVQKTTASAVWRIACVTPTCTGTVLWTANRGSKKKCGCD